jgi:hypothetical protein
MVILNVHQRAIEVPSSVAGDLLDQLGSDRDRLWPGDRWPRMRLDHELALGAAGGHGGVRYTCIGYQPGRWARFQFREPAGFDGFHEFTGLDHGAGTRLTHLIVMRTRGSARVTWPLVFRPLHDALLEDALRLADPPMRQAHAEANSASLIETRQPIPTRASPQLDRSAARL